jgi:signal transduction histidine kinase/anti-sigma regulatory factor (Ser/Thr protein kinase)
LTKLAEVRASLAAELAKPAPDFDQISKLVTELLQCDPERARFSVDAGMVARLGRELVARHETALSELVKNAYDADATRVAVRIAGRSKGDYVEIADDGLGMTRDAFVQRFMRLATNDKVEHPLSPGGRRRAGRKGVGRFAAERLGKRLILTTCTAEAKRALKIEIDWERFSAGLDLSSISIPIGTVEKPRPHGTIIRIERLRDSWSLNTIQRTFEEIADLIDLGDQTKAPAQASSSFNVTFTGDDQTHRIVDIRSEVAAQAYATIEAKIDATGAATWSLSCPKLKLDIKDRSLRIGENETNKLTLARGVRLKTYYYILRPGYFPPTTLRTVQSYLAVRGGIRLFRNGFRVRPYGQVGDDWLGLDRISSQRTRTLAPIRNRNFLGSVSIDDNSGLFEETSSREGLIGSEVVSELTAAMSSAILTAVREIDAERSRRDLKGGTPPRPPLPLFDTTEEGTSEKSGNEGDGIGAARELTAAVQAVRMEIQRELPSTSSGIVKALERVANSAEVVARKAEESDRLLKEIDLLRVLASMGLAIGQFTHEFSTLSGAMRASLAVLLEVDRSETERSDAARAIRVLLDQARDFTGLFKSMTEENALRDRQALDLYEAVAGFRTAMSGVLGRNAVQMDIEDDGDQLYTPPMHRSELFAVLLNFTTNSIKAIKRAGHAGQILVRLGVNGSGNTTLSFLDNGDGIAEEVADTLFDPFVTTTAARPTSSREDDIQIGSGLGLAIVRDVVQAAGGQVAVGKAHAPYATCLVITLPSGGAI